MKKKWIACLLAGTMGAAMLAGCGSSDSSSSSDTTTSESAAAETASADTTASEASTEAAVNEDGLTQEAQDAIAERKESGDYPTVVMAFMNFAGSPAGLDRINAAISAITEEKLGVDVELMIMDSASYQQDINLMLSSGEQVDLFNALRPGLTSAVNNGYVYDLEEDDLMAKYGSGIPDAVGQEYLDSCRVGGVLYGVPTNKDNAAGKFGIAVPAQYLDEIGIDYNSMYANEDDEIIYTDMDTIDDILAKLHEQYPDKTTLFVDKGTVVGQCLSIDQLGSDPFGVLLDPTNSLEVEDLFSSDVYMDLCKTWYGWNQAGYLSKDALTETTATTVQVKAGSLCAYKTATKPGIRQQESNLCGMDMVIFQIGDDFMGSNACTSMPWCINSQTEDPVAAMQVLNAFYTDSELSTLLCWGEEGVDYVNTEDGHHTFPDGVTAENAEYYNNVNWELPNQFIAGVWEGDDLDLWDQMKEFNDSAARTKAFGFTFDNSSVSAEYTALENVYEEYRDQLELGFVDPEVGIPEMEAELEAAGLDTYIAEKQSQLDAWAEENGVQ